MRYLELHCCSSRQSLVPDWTTGCFGVYTAWFRADLVCTVVADNPRLHLLVSPIASCIMHMLAVSDCVTILSMLQIANNFPLIRECELHCETATERGRIDKNRDTLASCSSSILPNTTGGRTDLNISRTIIYAIKTSHNDIRLSSD